MTSEPIRTFSVIDSQYIHFFQIPEVYEKKNFVYVAIYLAYDLEIMASKQKINK